MPEPYPIFRLWYQTNETVDKDALRPRRAHLIGGSEATEDKLVSSVKRGQRLLGQLRIPPTEQVRVLLYPPKKRSRDRLLPQRLQVVF